MNPITVFQLASWTIGLWDNWIVGIEAGAGPISVALTGGPAVLACAVRLDPAGGRGGVGAAQAAGLY